MAGKKKGNFASARSALVKALRNMEKTVAGLVPVAVGGKAKSRPKRKAKKRKTKSRWR